MKKILWAFLAFVLLSVPAHAQKWATATFHTSQPIDQVFEPTARLIDSKSWYLGTRWHVRSIDRAQKTMQIASVSFGQQWGEFYITVAPEGTGTSIQSVMTLYAGAHLHPADYAVRFAKGLKKLFPDLTWNIQRDVVPGNFALGVGQVSIPQVAVTAPETQPMQGPTVVYPAAPPADAQVSSIDNSLKQIAASSSRQPISQQQSYAPTASNLSAPTVAQEPMRNVPYTAPAIVPMQSSVANQGTVPISPAQINSIDNSLQQIASNLSPRPVAAPVTPVLTQQQNRIPSVPMIVPASTPYTAPAYTAPGVIPMQNYAPNQQIQMGLATQNLGLAMMAMVNERNAGASAQAARSQQRVDQVATSSAVTRFLLSANQTMSRYLAMSGSEAAAQYDSTARAITKARDDVYVTLTDPAQKEMFNGTTNQYMLAFGKQMSDHMSQQTSADRVREMDEKQYTDNLHHALDSWYAGGKDWQKIPPEMWNKLTERDKGRLKDGIDPETINVRSPNPEHSPQP